jgi:hypothetical protein
MRISRPTFNLRGTHEGGGDACHPGVDGVSDADEKDLAALLTTELSADSEITLVERDDLAKVGTAQVLS